MSTTASKSHLASPLTRDKRSNDEIADTEVRTIISAIVDAILDGDKKKRSAIPVALSDSMVASSDPMVALSDSMVASSDSMMASSDLILASSDLILASSDSMVASSDSIVSESLIHVII
eukprot:gene6514-7258_t